MKSYQFKIWVIGLTRALKTQNILDFYMNLDNKKLSASFFNALAIRMGAEKFEELQLPWISGLSNSSYYEMWKNMKSFDHFIMALGIQYEYRMEEKNISIPKHKPELFDILFSEVYPQVKQEFNILNIFNFDDRELEALKKIERSHQAELVFGSPHRYSIYNKFWKIKEEEVGPELFYIDGDLVTEAEQA